MLAGNYWLHAMRTNTLYGRICVTFGTYSTDISQKVNFMNIFDLILSILCLHLIWVQIPEARRKMNEK